MQARSGAFGLPGHGGKAVNPSLVGDLIEDDMGKESSKSFLDLAGHKRVV